LSPISAVSSKKIRKMPVNETLWRGWFPSGQGGLSLSGGGQPDRKKKEARRAIWHKQRAREKKFERRRISGMRDSRRIQRYAQCPPKFSEKWLTKFIYGIKKIIWNFVFYG
jgi:hypothetical protein